MKKLYSLLLALVLGTVAINAQNSPVFRQRLEIAEVTDEENGLSIEVFRMQDNGRYYLSVGHLGFGDDIVQFHIDPVFELFIPLGETLSEALENLKTYQGYYKLESGAGATTVGCLSALYPNDDFEKVSLTYRKVLLSKTLEFSVERRGAVRATHIPRSMFNSLVASVKIYQKIHPKE